LQAAIDAGRQVWADEYRFRRADGAYADVLDRGFVLRDGDGAALRMVGAMLDVSERKRVQDALSRSERMAAIGALVAGVAHEVRTPLFGISASLDAYEAQLHEPQERRELVELLRAQVDRLAALMRDLLDYGGPPALRLAPGGVAAALRKALRACAPLAEAAGVALEAEPGAPSLELERDPGRIEQVFENLLSNAIHHTRRGGRVRVRVAASGDTAPGVSCAVEDEGPGIAEEDLAKVFEPFFSRRKGGTGLGLAIVRRIVEEHGGFVRAANRPEGGAVFTVFLPARRPARRAAGTGSPARR
jgi:signal transduction histidine kinase